MDCGGGQRWKICPKDFDRKAIEIIYINIIKIALVDERAQMQK